MSEKNSSYLTFAYLFLTAFSSSVTAGLQRVTARGPSSPNAALWLGLLAPTRVSSVLLLVALWKL